MCIFDVGYLINILCIRIVILVLEIPYTILILSKIFFKIPS